MKFTIYCCFLLVVLTGCSSLKKIGIEIAVQPPIPIDDNIQSLVLLNRSMTSKFTNINRDSLEKILIGNQMSIDQIFYDSIATDSVIQSTAKELFKSGRFDVVVPEQRNIFREENEILKPLNNSFIKEICWDYQVDAVLVLENYKECLQTKYILNKSLGIAYGPSIFVASTTLINWPEWNLYSPDQNSKVKRIELCEPIFWKKEDENMGALYAKMPKTKSSLISGGVFTGLVTAESICPGRSYQTRFYYLTRKGKIDAAKYLIEDNKWEDAAVIWSKYASEKSAGIRSKIEYNLALASEMLGDTDLAMEWALKSFKTRYTKASEVYLKTLDKKKKEQLREPKKLY